ncbi:MAG TPA: ADOP family duplicated permease [Vicinamibacterales bacterium]|nr:ADOP family duplicated permease [Vicinamibacterales bacterium]
MIAGPPRLAELVVAWSLRAEERAAVLGDLQEEFSTLLAADGRSAARRWYWTQAIRSFLPNVTRRHAASRRSAAMFSTDTIAQDLVFGWRMLRRRPLVTTIAVLSLVSGLSMAAVVFNLLNAIVLRPLPVENPDRLMVLLARRGANLNHNFSYPDFQDYRARQQTFVDLTAYSRADVTVRLDAGSEVLPAEFVAGSYFTTLGVGTRFGRGLTDADVTAGAPLAAVVSDRLWRRIAGDGAAFDGRAVTINDRPFTIVGVAAPGFGGMIVGRDVRVWVPLTHRELLEPGRAITTDRFVSWLTLVGRLKPGVNENRAAADLDRIEAALGPAVQRTEQRTFVLAAGGQGDSMLPSIVASPLRLLLGAALLVLVVACANVASLLVSRTVERGREIAVRTALGASRLRIARMLMVETLLLSGVGAVFGMGVSVWAARLAVRLITQFGEPVAVNIGVDWGLFGFVAAAALATALLSALAPIVHVLRTPAAGGLGVGGRQVSAAPAAARLRSGLVVVQFALSLALVGSAALLVRTIVNLRAVPTGFDLDHVALVAIDPVAAHLGPDQAQQFLHDVESRLAAVPGVRAAAYGRIIPIGFGGSRGSIAVPGYLPAADEDMEINYNAVSPSYFDATGIARADGRIFSDADPLTGPIPAVVNETMARRYWPGGRAVGRLFQFDGADGPPMMVVGVVVNVKYRMIREPDAPSFYLPYRRVGRPRAGIMHVRVEGDPAALLPELRRVAMSVDPRVPVSDVRTLRDQVWRNLSTERMAMTIAVALGGAALLLAAVGLFGAMSNLVGQRRREIGVRLALGARPSEVARLVVGQGLRLSLLGSLLGLGLAFWLGRLLEARLYGVAAFDPFSLAASVAVLAGVAAVATWAPAGRAARTNPVDALRAE